MSENAVERLVLTAGEPAGIGPDLLVQLAQQEAAWEWVVIADPAVLQARAKVLGLPLILEPFIPNRPAQPKRKSQLTVLAEPVAEPVEPGVLNPANSAYVLRTLKRATDGCLQHTFVAMVTAPVHKGVINEAGIPFTGHTELIAEWTQTPRVVMLLAAGALRVALATTHLPLRAVADAINPADLTHTLRILQQSLQTLWGIAHPRILVCGLNPHAGEQGHLGTEEVEIIIPCLDALRQEGFDVVGPLPADTLFTPPSLQGADAVLAMYHDQGLPVLKYQGFGSAVNITLGLPIIRTSVDHGTALPLAGTGRAEVGSLQAAIREAVRMAVLRAS